MRAILKRELGYFFHTPAGYVYLAINLFISGLLFTLICLFTQSADFSRFLQTAVLLFLLGAPLLTMRLFTQDRRDKTDQLLLTAPVKVESIVLGKALSALVVFFVSCAAVACYLVPLAVLGSPGWAKIIGSFVGYILLGLSFISLGCYVSSVCESQISAAIVTFCLVFVFWIIESVYGVIPGGYAAGIVFSSIVAALIGWWLSRQTKSAFIGVVATLFLGLVILVVALASRSLFVGLIAKTLAWASLTKRYADFGLGILRWGNVLYYLSFSFFFLYLTRGRIERRRWLED